MTHKIIVLAIDALLALADKGRNSTTYNSFQFDCDLSDAIKSLRKVKKYL